MEKNKRKEEYIELSNKVDKVITNIETLKPDWPKTDNIVETYINKTEEIDSILNKKNLSLYSDNCELGRAILLNLNENLNLGITSIITIGTKTIEMKNEKIGKNSKKRKAKTVKKTSQQLKQLKSYIENYDIIDNLSETIIMYYKKSQKINIISPSITKIREELKDLGYDIPITEAQIKTALNPKIRQTTTTHSKQRIRTY